MPPKKKDAPPADTARADLPDLEAVLDAAADAGSNVSGALAVPMTRRRQIEAVVVFDVAGRIRYANAAACRSHGYAREEILRLRIDDLGAPAGGPSLRERLAALGPDGAARFELTNRRKDGTTFPAETQVSVITLGGERLLVGSARDTSDRSHLRLVLL